MLTDDLRHALRGLRKAPGFTVVALLTIALGVGANTALFSIVDGVLLRPLPFPDADQLVGVHASKPNFDRGSISFPNFRDWRRANTVFSRLAVSRNSSFIVTGQGTPDQIDGAFVSSEFLPLLGVQPLLGRGLAIGEDEVGAAPVVLIGAALWQRRFASSPDVLGSTLTLDGHPYTIVGVVPRFPLHAANLPRTAEVYVPIGQWANDLLLSRGAGLGIHGIARLKPGVTLAQARADMDAVTRALAEAHPEENKGVGAAIVPLKEQVVGPVRSVILLLFAAVAFVLLIACVNVANLMLARSSGRAREFAVRTALGAGRGRIVRQLLTESMLLGVLGGALGVLLAILGTRAVLGLSGEGLPRMSEVHVDTRVLGFTLLISLLSGALFGLAPALAAVRSVPHESLRGTAGLAGGHRRSQDVLVVLEVALALVLLVGAGLMVRTLTQLWSVDPGFDPERVLTFNVSLPTSIAREPPETIRAALRDLEATIGSTPGIRAVSLYGGAFPLGGDDEQLFWLDGEPRPSSSHDMKWTLSYVVGPGYLESMSIRLFRGRFLGPQDGARTAPVAVVDEVFARTYFPDGEAVGRRIRLDRGTQPVEIVGIVAHVKQWGLDTDDHNSLRAQLYVPWTQASDGLISLLAGGVGVTVRTEGDPGQALVPLRAAIGRMGGQHAVFGAQTMPEIVTESLGRQRFTMVLFAIFGGLALLLAAIGIYGVVSYLVGQRTGELGLRMALGAQRSEILRLILAGGGRLTAVGVVLGTASALGLTRLMEGLLYGVRPTDPPTFIAVGLGLVMVALAACAVPARRASRVDPMVALR
ncbi:MAG TPA: ABC transporter permease, partial [Myxococcaceae bacterium]|nr:ABC transporter permease [Myxococcaceae bacterium]